MKNIELHITLQGQVLDTQGQALNRACLLYQSPTPRD